MLVTTNVFQNLIIIADYGVGDPAFTEVTMQIRNKIPGVTIIPQSVPPFSTLNTGFWIYQLALTKNISNTYIFSNTAPRKHESKAQKNNSGEKLMYAKLKNGFEIIAVDAGFTFSFIKPYITEFKNINVDNHGSQFRSRDIFPQAIADVLHGTYSLITTDQDTESIPNVPESVIASIDGYGNIKTTIRHSHIQKTNGEKLQITIGDTTHEATYTNGTFNVEDGQLAFAPGSSGHEDKFMELFYRGKNASALFNNPPVESPITLIFGQ